MNSNELLSFGQALYYLKDGKKLAREGWNGFGMFIYYVPEASYTPFTDVEKGAFELRDVPYGAFIAMKTNKGNVVPWVASQTDILSDDWYIS